MAAISRLRSNEDVVVVEEEMIGINDGLQDREGLETTNLGSSSLERFFTGLKTADDCDSFNWFL